MKRPKQLWRYSKWKSVDGIGLFNGGACNETHNVKRGFFERLAYIKWVKKHGHLKGDEGRRGQSFAKYVRTGI